MWEKQALDRRGEHNIGFNNVYDPKVAVNPGKFGEDDATFQHHHR
jgi:hypothetical protein